MTAAFPLEVVDEAGSTSDVLKARADAGAGEAALLARRQTAGHGRLGRPWRSIDGNLHLSVLLRPGSLPWPGHWSLLAAVALAGAVQADLPDGLALRLNWPNDLLLNGGKLAGVLLEAGGAADPWLVIGFGVNLAGAPDGLGRPVACLADAGVAPDPDGFARRLLTGLQAWRTAYQRDGFEPVRAAWLRLGPRMGDVLSVSSGAAVTTGSFRGLGDDGALLLDGADGPVTIVAGEVGE